MVPPSSFQEVTPGPLSYGTTSGAPTQGPLADKWRAEVCFHHNLYDTIEAQGHQFGIKHPVALLTGTCALVLLVIIATLRPTAPSLHSSFVDPDTGMFVSAEGELLFQQLPCWTGSCDHWQFEDPNDENPLDFDECDELSAGFGCNPCKREFTPGTGGLSDYKKSGRVVVCPSAPADGEIVGEYMAMRAKEYPQSLGMLHLPCVGACCSYYLLQAALCPHTAPKTAHVAHAHFPASCALGWQGDSQGFLKQDQVCDFWATTFGCGSRCNSTNEVSAVKDLKDFVAAEGLLHPDSRVAKCGAVLSASVLSAGQMKRTASGIEYVVREWATPKKNASGQ